MTLILTGLACGTILYVAFFEILERERSKATVGLFQWSLLLLGFLLMLGLEVAGIFCTPRSFKNYVVFIELSLLLLSLTFGGILQFKQADIYLGLLFCFC